MQAGDDIELRLSSGEILRLPRATAVQLAEALDRDGGSVGSASIAAHLRALVEAGPLSSAVLEMTPMEESALRRALDAQ